MSVPVLSPDSISVPVLSINPMSVPILLSPDPISLFCQSALCLFPFFCQPDPLSLFCQSTLCLYSLFCHPTLHLSLFFSHLTQSVSLFPCFQNLCHDPVSVSHNPWLRLCCSCDQQHMISLRLYLPALRHKPFAPSPALYQGSATLSHSFTS